MRKPKTRKTQACSAERGEIARRKLIEAGLKIFSDVGYEAASTRDLAAAAEVNIAAIPYYFNSKEGLYHAVIDHIIEYYHHGLGDILTRIKAALEDESTTPAEYGALLHAYMRTSMRFVLQPSRERAQVSHIYIREQFDPTSAFDRLYAGFIHDAHETLAELVGRVIGVNELTPEVRLLTQTLLGQISVFKLSRETIQHNMGWKQYGEAEIAEIERLILHNVDVIMRTYQQKGATP